MIAKIIEILSSYRFDVTEEKTTQAAISAALLEHGIAHEREYGLEPGSIIDFFIQERHLTGSTVQKVKGIGIEVKLNGGAYDIYSQLRRYCATGKLSAILLVSNRAMGLPQEIEGVPAYYLPLGRGWL